MTQRFPKTQRLNRPETEVLARTRGRDEVSSCSIHKVQIQHLESCEIHMGILLMSLGNVDAFCFAYGDLYTCAVARPRKIDHDLKI